MLLRIVQVYTDSSVSVEIPELLKAEYRQAGATHMRFASVQAASRFFSKAMRKAKRANNGVTQSTDRTGMAKLNDKLEPVRQPPKKHGPYDDGVKRYKTFAQK